MRRHPLSRIAAAAGTAALAAGLLIAPTATAAPQSTTAEVTTTIPAPSDGWRITCSARQRKSHWFRWLYCARF